MEEKQKNDNLLFIVRDNLTGVKCEVVSDNADKAKIEVARILCINTLTTATGTRRDCYLEVIDVIHPITYNAQGEE